MASDRSFLSAGHEENGAAMVTISLCMIVRNEEAVLARCLDSVSDLVDEIIIVDTGSTDATREIASRYTNRIFDFSWQDDFSKARNFAFSKATKDYIYSADADEVLDGTNRVRFRELKEVLLPDIEIVQMKYVESENQSVLNADWEYRPKLYKRQRSFVWIDPVHETVRTEPLVFDSDIEIQHRPQGLHVKRDFSIFATAYAKDGRLSKKLYSMYATEVYKCGMAEDVHQAADIFLKVCDRETIESDLFCKLCCIIARSARMLKNDAGFLKYSMKVVSSSPCSEICMELGEYFYAAGDYTEASIWFTNAAYECDAILDIHAGGDMPLLRLADTYEHMAEASEDVVAAKEYKRLAAESRSAAEAWRQPEEQV